jgi:hypothetical protein
MPTSAVIKEIKPGVCRFVYVNQTDVGGQVRARAKSEASATKVLLLLPRRRGASARKATCASKTSAVKVLLRLPRALTFDFPGLASARA